MRRATPTRYEICELYNALVDGSGDLPVAYHCGDGVHYSAAGYAIWKGLLGW